MYRSLRFKITDENFETLARMATLQEAAALVGISEAWLCVQLERDWSAEAGQYSITVENRVRSNRRDNHVYA